MSVDWRRFAPLVRVERGRIAALCALAVAGIAFLAWNSGIGTFIRIAIGWLPRRKVAIADLAASTLDPSRPEGDRELVAALRADPEIDAAFKRAKGRKQKGTT